MPKDASITSLLRKGEQPLTIDAEGRVTIRHGYSFRRQSQPGEDGTTESVWLRID